MWIAYNKSLCGLFELPGTCSASEIHGYNKVSTFEMLIRKIVHGIYTLNDLLINIDKISKYYSQIACQLKSSNDVTV